MSRMALSSLPKIAAWNCGSLTSALTTELACASTALSRHYRRAERGKVKSGLCYDGIVPMCRRFDSESPQRGPGDEVVLEIERVVDGGMDAEEAMGGSS